MRIVIAVLFLAGALFTKDSQQPLDFAEKLSYRLVYNGVSGADAEICTNKNIDNSVRLYWSVITSPVFSFLFPVENKYETFLDNTEKLIGTSKNIAQRNIKQQMTIDYDFEKNQAISNEGLNWQVTQNTTNLMGMLHDLRKRNPQAGDSLHYTLDVETQLWQLNGTVKFDTLYMHQQEMISARQILLHFTPLDSMQPRPWKTDLFTNNVAGADAELQIIMGPHPQNIPFFIQFLNGKKRVELYLKE